MQVTKEDRIAALEAEMAQLNARTMTTSAQGYGIQRSAPLEVFQNDVHNIKKNPDLMPCPRRPPGKKWNISLDLVGDAANDLVI